MYKKVYLYMGKVTSSVHDEIDRFSFLFEEWNMETIWKHWRLMENGNTLPFMKSVEARELFLFYNYIKKELWEKIEFEIIYNEGLFIHNEELFKVKNGEITKMKLKKALFCSLRPACIHPIFFLLEKVLRKKWGQFKKTNFIKREISLKCKFYALNSLYSERDRFIGNIIIPYNIKEKDYSSFREYMIQEFSSEIVIKKDCTSAWKWVWMIDVDDYDLVQYEKFWKAMSTQNSFNQSIYITRYENFEEEYRFYFTKEARDIQIYSVKKKKVLTERKDVLGAEWFEYNKDVRLLWEYIENDSWKKKYKKEYDFAKKYIKRLDYINGALEFWKTVEWKMIFFEVNAMAAPICYKWEDEKNMIKYNLAIFKDVIN